MRSVDFHPEASREVLQALDYYAERDSVVAIAFNRELSAAIDRVEEAPERWPSYMHGTQRVLVHHYPYSVVYRVTTERIEVVAVAHQSKRPGYWRARLKKSRPSGQRSQR